jgi:D-alanyl-lipoteichoic acid acyltransferase DltB (MBOAT superfamily)
MLFNSIVFIFAFLPIILVMYYLIERFGERRWAIFCLSIASAFFYGWWNPLYVILILGSLTANFFMGLAIQKVRAQESRLAKPILLAAVALNVLLLVYFKYTNFFAQSLASILDGQAPYYEIALPLAISFFTFQQIAFLVDIYRGDICIRAKTFNLYSLFVLFFPQLIAGPIVRYAHIAPQLKKPLELKTRHYYIALGISIFCLGLFKKVGLADTFSVFVTPSYTQAFRGITPDAIDAWKAIFAYGFQIYFDFSGYSDMAYGLGLMFGVQLPINFYSPYKAQCINDYWRRWNITLGQFFRDYLYIPLGGGRVILPRAVINVIIVMFVSGLWHGAAWTFVIWGLMHGIAMTVATFWGRGLDRLNIKDALYQKLPYRLLMTLVTFTFVSLGWVLFRGDNLSASILIYKGLANISPTEVITALGDATISVKDWLFAWPNGRNLVMPVDTRLSLLLCMGFLIVFFMPNNLQIHKIAREGAITINYQQFTIRRGLVMGVLTASAITILIKGHSTDFLYFVF